MQNLNNFLIISDSLVPEKNLVYLDDGLVSDYYPVVYKEHFCFYHGIFHNSSELFLNAGKDLETIEAVLIELYLTDPEKFPSLLAGNFSLVIGNKEELYLLRDGNGYENLYFSVSFPRNGGILVSNSIKEIARYVRLEVNRDILPGYFLKTDVNSGDTFFKDIRTLAFFEYGKLNIRSLTFEKGFFDWFFTKTETVSEVNTKQVINECDNLIGNIINEKFSQLSPHFKVINALSGGTDSSYIQYCLKKNNSVIAYTANFIKAGLDHAYASDVARLMDLKHKTIHSDTGYLINSLPKGIFLSEKPFLFAGETLLLHMYEEIGKDFNVPVVCFDGTGAEGILGASKILYELRVIRKYRKLFGLILPFFKLRSKKLYNRYKEFYTYVNSRTIPDNFILRYFTDEQIRDTVKDAFKLHDLNHIDEFEISMMKKYNTCLFEAVYRFLSFELEYKRVNNIRTQLAKKNGISLVFPFTETCLFKYLIRVDTEIKLRDAKTKYLLRRAMEKKFPKNIVYRKKVMKNVSVFDEILQNEKTKEIIREIKSKQYPYFNFNYDEVFGSPGYASLAYKLINFHIWHKLFIDMEDFVDVDYNLELGTWESRQKAEGSRK
jgi:asparagine synthase (glutamine-hydrolysing)